MKIPVWMFYCRDAEFLNAWLYSYIINFHSLPQIILITNLLYPLPMSYHTNTLQFHDPLPGGRTRTYIELWERYKSIHRHSMAGVANTQLYENVWDQPQNLNVQMLRPYAATLLDLSMESNVNGGNTTAQHFSVKILLSFHVLQQQL